MKKVIIVIAVLMSIILIDKDKEQILIPNEAIRIRVIANSNEENDLSIKNNLKDDINNEVEKLLKNVRSIEEAREILTKNIPNITVSVEKSLKRLNYNKDFNINYGLNYFPEKEFKEIKYPSGYYESLVITLGKGEGNNYWCVLYPPLCLIEENDNNYEYRSIVKDLLDKYF